MIQHLFTIYRKLAKLAAQRVRAKRLAVLNVWTLEERATPAVDIVSTVQPPQTVVIAPGAAEPTDAKPIVRMDLVPVGGTVKHEAEHEWDDWATYDIDYQADPLMAKKADRLDFGTTPIGLEITDEDLGALADELAAEELAAAA